MMQVLRVLSLVWLASWFAVGSVAQDIKYLDPAKLERATVKGDDGLHQWVAWEAPKCPNCTGTGKGKCTTCERFAEDATSCPECHRKEGREVKCRTCAGEGTLPDPLQKALCPGCMGAGFLGCTVCGLGGHLKVDGAKNWSDCPGCRGEGAFPCTVCKGDRMIPTLALKPSLGEANSETLKKALTTVDQTLTQLGAFAPTGGTNTRKELKELLKVLDGPKNLSPAFKVLPKYAKDYVNKILGGAQFQGHEEHEAEAMTMVKQHTEYYLKHQKRMMELAFKRAEANELAGGK